MATLQNIRTKGPLLVIVIGLALFAFIAGDAWKVLRPNQAHDAGAVNGKAISAQEYQAMIEEYTEVIKFSSGLNTLNDEQLNQIKDEAWSSYISNKLIEAEAKKIGLTVSKAEVQAIIDEGKEPILQQTPFRNAQTGAFDKDELKSFLVSYAKINRAAIQPQYLEYYDSMNKLWLFFEKNLIQGRLVEKYRALMVQAISSNPIEAQTAFESRVNQAEMLIAAIPYSAIPDSTITVTNADIKKLYNKKKEQFRQFTEVRNIKYIDIQVKASETDKVELEKEVDDYSVQLKATISDYPSFIRSTGSNYPYVDIYYRKEAYPEDIASRLADASEGNVYGPYYNVSDNTINAFKYLSKTRLADSIQFRQIQVYRENATQTKVLADSIFDVIKKGASFEEVAKKYGQEGTLNWLSSGQYEKTPLEGDNLKYIKAITSLGVNEYANLSLGQGNVILQVTAQRAVKEKFKVAVVKRTVEFSKETYNKAYNEFSRFVAANPTLDKVKANAEEAGYTLSNYVLNSAEHGIANIRGTKEALRWVFSAKSGEVSTLYECGDSDRLLLVALEQITRKGYRPVEQVNAELATEVRKDKKAEKIMASVNHITAFDQYKTTDNAVNDTIKHVTFSAPAYVSVLRSSEPLVSAYASVGELNSLSNPIKGNAGVFVLQIYAKDKQSDTFDVETEKTNQVNMNTRLLSNFLNDLRLKANIKDDRYLFF
ncbi:MAG: SurA N-terminal domain-containing protein [Mediterranea sp.]|jgi:peptidyl-prolyl cis-trans isomerase D|nr:SurA N-terminal domain-containing protein [Mediterranea sp.]